MNSNKWAIGIAIVGGVIAIVKMVIQNRQMLAVKTMEKDAQAQLADSQRQNQERAARHAAEAAEREVNHALREAEMARLQESNKRTLDMLEGQIKAHQEASEKRYAIIERNTAAVEKTASALATQAQELRVLVDRVGRLEGGAGCRAGAS